MTEGFLIEVAANALSDFARTAVIVGAECVVNDIIVDVAARPHKPRGLPIGKMAVYCFFLNRQALKIGVAGPKSGARFQSQHYNPNSAQSTLAGSILKHPGKIGISSLSANSVGEWIKAHTHRINLFLPASHGRPMLLRLESYLHTTWKPVYEGPVCSD